jgi:hypothetical protein
MELPLTKHIPSPAQVQPGVFLWGSVQERLEHETLFEISDQWEFGLLS